MTSELQAENAALLEEVALLNFTISVLMRPFPNGKRIAEIERDSQGRIQESIRLLSSPVGQTE